jgi:BirA family biotin operon repressor/biotin-[acetyl-CoA-carboxylase] ligase
MPGSPYTNLHRPPLREAGLRRALLVPGGLWTRLDLRGETGSTNVDVAAEAAAGAGEGLIVVAERQTAGKGRLGRVWESPPRAGIAVSVLLRPGDANAERGWASVTPQRYGWLPLLAGVALAESVSRLGELVAELKWPNDLLVDGRKCGGILAETVPERAVVLGIGLNVTLDEDELPHPGATSLKLAGAACTDRDPLLRALLRALASWYSRWRDAAGDPVASGLRGAYLRVCDTLGRQVSVALPGDGNVGGPATTVDFDGRLVVAGRALAAGDVTHVRPAQAGPGHNETVR